jgi:hypothetical protein
VRYKAHNASCKWHINSSVILCRWQLSFSLLLISLHQFCWKLHPLMGVHLLVLLLANPPVQRGSKAFSLLWCISWWFSILFEKSSEHSDFPSRLDRTFPSATTSPHTLLSWSPWGPQLIEDIHLCWSLSSQSTPGPWELALHRLQSSWDLWKCS